MFVLSFKNSSNDPTTNSFYSYYIPLIEIKEAYEKLIEMSNNDDYTIGYLLDYLYHQNYYKPIGIDLSR